MEKPDTDIKLLTLDEAAVILKVNRRTLYRLVAYRQVPGFFKVGKQWRIHESELQKWIRDKKQLILNMINATSGQSLTLNLFPG